MSYDIYLVNPVNGEKLILDAPHQMRGGTYALGGTYEAHLNITYNYGVHYRRIFGDEDAQLSTFDKLFGGGQTGIRKIYGMTGAESIPILQTAADLLKDDVDEDYWNPTEGNAKQALLQLIALAKMRPDGVWEGD
jgi:hypothetical protein